VSWSQWLLGLVLAVAIAGGGYTAGALSRSGALAAVLVGGITFGAGGLMPAALLIFFFVSSSILSRLGGSQKRAFAAAFAKGGRRDHGQVFANGGLAALAALGYGISGDRLWLAALAGALAAATADTWATELGVLSPRQPRLITSWALVPPGTSGGVTLQGTLASAAGAALIGLIAGLMEKGFDLAVACLAGGLAGSLLDSLLGATLQGIYYCPRCDKETERHPQHGCGSATQLVRGWEWLGNDVVNFAATALGAFVGLVVLLLWA
jgi:uncharacterized protein (TIGR00297 family)